MDWPLSRTIKRGCRGENESAAQQRPLLCGKRFCYLASAFPRLHARTRTLAAPLSESIRKIAPGKISGQMEVTLVSQQDALSYQLRWAPVGPGRTPENWTERPVGKAKQAALVHRGPEQNSHPKLGGEYLV